MTRDRDPGPNDERRFDRGSWARTLYEVLAIARRIYDCYAGDLPTMAGLRQP